MWQYHPDAHQCQEASNSSSLHPPESHGNTFECSSDFEKISVLQYIRPNDMVVPSGHQSEFKEKKYFLRRHRYGKTAATVWKTGIKCPDAILNKARRGEELQSSRCQGNTVRTPILIMKIACSRSVTVRTLGQHRPDVALFKKGFQCFLESRLHN